LKLITDDKIPYVSDFFTNCDEIISIPGEKITHAVLKNADILLTRTVTQIDAALLKNTAVKFVGSATSGVDHVDEKWLSKNHITFATAAGANAIAVAEYVLCVIAALNKEKKWSPHKNSVVGVIGCGRIGRIVATLFEKLNCKVICYDPLLIEKPHFHFVSLEALISQADLISIHTPLTKTGLHPTHHMIDQKKISHLKSNVILINTARGAVIDQSALLDRKEMTICLDVWENEPHISAELLQTVFIGTPHIAGYSLDAKYRATQMIYQQAAVFFDWHRSASTKKEGIDFKKPIIEQALSVYDPISHTKNFREAYKTHAQTAFTTARKNYVLRENILIMD